MWNIQLLDKMKKTNKIILIFALGFEFIGLVLGGSFAGYILGRAMNWKQGVGEAFGTLIGLLVALIASFRILKLLAK